MSELSDLSQQYFADSAFVLFTHCDEGVCDGWRLLRHFRLGTLPNFDTAVLQQTGPLPRAYKHSFYTVAAMTSQESKGLSGSKISRDPVDKHLIVSWMFIGN